MLSTIIITVQYYVSLVVEKEHTQVNCILVLGIKKYFKRYFYLSIKKVNRDEVTGEVP